MCKTTLMERIQKEIDKKMMEKGIMGTETVTIFLNLTDEEMEEFDEITSNELCEDDRYSFEIECNNRIMVSFSEEKKELRKKHNYFTNREDCIKFLEGFNFKYYVPRFDEFMSMNRYHVQLTDDFKKVYYCQIEFLQDGLIWNKCPFFDIDRTGDFKTIEEGERNYIEKLEMDKILANMED